MISPPNSKRGQKLAKDPRRPMELQEILQGLRLVLEMGPDHLDGAIDLLDEAIVIDQQKTDRFSRW